ncbi:CDP-alcohol phosphatidyltransferase family protein [Salinarimonas chemoclinalis]|uniref:CDP-alcohol phosphatidyltransferase family protein n=1 Tax=Salinarimonas chemoclinalis TaxID=3241599 RepID=UPI003556B3A0
MDVLVGRMGEDEPESAARRSAGDPLPRTLAALAGGLVVLVGLGAAVATIAAPSALAVATALGLYAAIAVVVAARVRPYHPHALFGAANGVTLVRAAINCLLAGMLVDVERLTAPGTPLGLVVLALALGSLALDGFDGFFARRLRLESRFGARFDVEVDGLLLTLLSVAAWRLDKAGAWVLLIGATYYLFLAARRMLPWLEGPLAPSFRRKAVCVLQGAILIALMLPGVQPPASEAIAAVALVALAWSFGVDIRDLWRVHRLSDAGAARGERGPAGSPRGSSGHTGSRPRGRGTH